MRDLLAIILSLLALVLQARAAGRTSRRRPAVGVGPYHLPARAHGHSRRDPYRRADSHGR
jgi:hypothetical protein